MHGKANASPLQAEAKAGESPEIRAFIYVPDIPSEPLTTGNGEWWWDRSTFRNPQKGHW